MLDKYKNPANLFLFCIVRKHSRTLHTNHIYLKLWIIYTHKYKKAFPIYLIKIAKSSYT